MTSFVSRAEYDVSSVSFGVQSAGLTQQVTVRLYTNAGGAFPGGTRTLIATSTVLVTSAQSGTVVKTPLVATVPAGTSELIMELFSPESGAPVLFLMGMNAAPETGPSYWSCQNDPPQVLNNHLVFNVYGSCSASTPTPTPTPTATATATATATPTATVCQIFRMMGRVTQCPANVGLAAVTITMSNEGSTTTIGGGTYLMFGHGCSFHTVTPTKAGRTPGSTGINTMDVLAVQRHFLTISLLTGCSLAAADVNGDNRADTSDVIAIQRFFLGLTTGTSNVGSYRFTPASRSYSPPVDNQFDQNYDTIVLGDVASPFAAP